MSKQGIYKISGNTKPKVGELVTYRIDEWYPATPREKRNPALVTWHLFKKMNGKFIPTNIKKVGVSSFTFNTTAYKDTFRIEAYLHNPEGRAPMALEVQPQPSDVPRINKVELKYIDDTPGTVFSFTEKLIAEAKCMNLEAQYLQFSLWEDDATDSGHNNQNLLIESKKEKVKNGTARAEFMLTKALMRKAMAGETNPQQLEFYVTVEYYAHKKHATNNVNVNTPEGVYMGSQKPKTTPPKEQPKAKGSPAEQKGKSKKEEKGIIETASGAIAGVISKIGEKIYDWAEAKGTVKKDQRPVTPPPSGNSPAKVGADPKSPAITTCICKEQYKDLIWGGKVSCEFRKKVILISKRANIDPNNLMAAMAHETGGTFDPTCGTFKKKKDETAEGYVGLLQIGKDAATDLKITRTELLAMDQIKQLDYIEKYINLPLVRGKLNTLTDFYLAVLFPVDCGKGNQSNHIVFDNSLPISYKNGKPIKNLNYWRNVGYAANPTFHKEGKKENGKTYVWEIAENIKIWYDKGKLNKVDKFSCQNVIETKDEPTKTNKWHDPVDNPICTLYMQSGGGGKGTSGEHWGLFGKTRNGTNHQGLDLFSLPGSNVYACVKGIVHKATWHSGYGNTITIKIIDKESFYNNRKDYSLLHAANGEINQSSNFDKTKDIFLFYAHLEEILVEEGATINAGKIIAKSGVSGVSKGTCAPHLHFEIFTTVYAVGMGLNYRCNPGFYINFKVPNEQSENELSLQKNTAKTRITNFYGKK